MSEISQAADAVNTLAERFWNGLLDLSPITATVLGYEQDQDRLDDPGPEGRDRARRLFRETLHATDAVEAQAGAAEHGSQALVVAHQRPRHGQPNGARLARQSAAVQTAAASAGFSSTISSASERAAST